MGAARQTGKGDAVLTDAETRNILRILQVAYPARYRGMSQADAQTMVEQWKPLEPFSAVKAAVEGWVSAHRFHPSVAEIREAMQQEAPSSGPTREEFRRTLRFYLSLLQQNGDNEAKIAEVKARYKDILEG